MPTTKTELSIQDIANLMTAVGIARRNAEHMIATHPHPQSSQRQSAELYLSESATLTLTLAAMATEV